MLNITKKIQLLCYGKNVLHHYIWTNVYAAHRCGLRRFHAANVTREIEIRNAISSTIIEPISGRSIGCIGVIQMIQINEGNVDITLDMIVPGLPSSQEVVCRIEEVVGKLGWVKNVNVYCVKSGYRPGRSFFTKIVNTANIEHIILVSSCKGGVGKSSIAVGIAIGLAEKKGLRVGLLDADIYGPSLPHLLRAADTVVRRASDTDKTSILPLTGPLGIKMLSFGYVNSAAAVPGAGGKGAAVLRGPIASKVINQLVAGTAWGDLDYLVVDMPPGTGDIQISICQSLAITGAVMVTTPHRLSLVDAAKGVQMFEELKVPTLAVVENMSFFDAGEQRYYPFGKGGRENLLRGLKLGLSEGSKASAVFDRLLTCPLHQLPLLEQKEDESSSLIPVSQNGFESPTAKSIFAALTDDIITEIYKLQLEAQSVPQLSLRDDIDKGNAILTIRYYGSTSAEEYNIDCMELRLRDPATGLRKEDIASELAKLLWQEVKPVKIDLQGNYGFAIIWSDGHHADIFKYEVVKKIAMEVMQK